MVPSIILSGFATPIENMPLVIQYFTQVNPMRHFLAIVRGVFLEGATTGSFVAHLPPIGLVYDATGAIVLDPGRQIQATVRLVFDTFKASGHRISRGPLLPARKPHLPWRRRLLSPRCDLSCHSSVTDPLYTCARLPDTDRGGSPNSTN